MKSINIKVLRTFKNNFSLFSGTILLSMLIALFVTACLSVGSTITDTVQGIMDGQNIESCEFVLLNDLDNPEEVEQKFNAEIDDIQYYDDENGDKTLRVFKENSKVDKPYVTDGDNLSNEDEIMINRDYAKNNDLAIGDKIDVNGTTFTICGFYLRPDYMYMLKSGSDPYVNKDNFGIAMVTEKAFEAHFTDCKKAYSAVFKEADYDNDFTISFREYLNEHYTILSYTSADSNVRITTANSLGEGVVRMVYTYSPVIYILIMGFLIVTLTRVMKCERKNIGIMLSFGYTKREIAVSYMKLVSIVSLIGSIIGSVIGILVTPALTNFYAADLIMPKINYGINIAGIVVAVVVPLILMAAAAYIYISRALRTDAVMLLRNTYTKKSSAKGGKAFSHSNANTAFKYNFRMILRNKLRYFIFLVGNFIAACLILMGIIIGCTINHVLDDQEKFVNSYEYSYRMKSVHYDYTGEGEAMLSASLETKDTGGSLAVTGIQDDSQYLTFQLKDGGDADISNGFYISYCASVFYDIQTGDTVTLIDPASLEEYQVKIDGVLDINKERAIYCSTENAAKLLGYENGAYNVVISDDPIHFDEGDLSTTVRSSNIVSTLKELFKPLMQTIYVIVALGAIMGIVVISMVSKLTTDENTSNIVMLKIFGYKRREIASMVFGLNKYFAIIGYLAALPVMMLLCKMMCISEIENYGLYMKVYFPWYYMLLTFVVYFAVFLLTQLWAQRKINSIPTITEQRE